MQKNYARMELFMVTARVVIMFSNSTFTV